MQPLLLLVLAAAPPAHSAFLIETAGRAEIAQKGVRDSAAHRAVAVLDSLIPLPAPGSLTRVQREAWTEQTTWLKSLRERVQNLLALVVAPAKVHIHAPIDQKNLLALQAEAEQESLKFDLSNLLLKARHEAAMASIRNIK